MKRLACAATVGLLAVLALSSACPAATITEVLAQQFDPTQYDFYTSGFGHSGYYLTWNNVDPVTNQFLSGKPGRDFASTAANNPSTLAFSTLSNGNNTGTGLLNKTASGTAPQYWSIYKLGVNTGQAWSMDFSILLYDPNFSGTDMAVELQGSVAGTDDYMSHDVSAIDVNGGIMLQYHIDAAANETVNVRVTSVGEEAYAAGFFMDNYSPGTAAASTAMAESATMLPEPATMLLLLAGAGGLVLKRRRR